MTVPDILYKYAHAVKLVAKMSYLTSGLANASHTVIDVPIAAMAAENYKVIFVVYAIISIVAMIARLFKSKK